MLKYLLIFITTISFITRFWNLNRFNKLIFDEVYYAVFAHNYFTKTQFFNVHPPLSQYLIALGMAITANQEGLSHLPSSFNYRLVNALIGSLIPLLAAAICTQLIKSRSYAIITAILFTFEGFFLVLSRYALSDIYIVFFGFGAHLFLLRYLNQQKTWQLLIAGVLFGCCVGVKWNGLGFLLGGSIFYFLAQKGNYNRATFYKFFYYLILVPIIIYVLIWIPHLAMNPSYGGFWEIHRKIINYHSRLGGGQIHPYCSPWYSWLLMMRPIAFYYQNSPDGKIIDDVHGMGNPFIWWLSTAAIAFLAFELGFHIRQEERGNRQEFKEGNEEGRRHSAEDPQQEGTQSNPDLVTIYILVNYAVNLLPWVKVTRCLFLYHYLSAYSFAILGLGWVVSRWCATTRGKILAALIIMIAISAFIFWAPIYYGLPLSFQEYYFRMWFRSWI